MTKKLIFLMLCLMGVFFLYQCDEKSPNKPKNHAPEITSITATPSSLDWGGESELAVTASDPDGDTLTYSWTTTGGLFISDVTADSVRWQAPDSTGSFNCAVAVSDGKLDIQKNVTIPVVGVFVDDFSGTLSRWSNSFCESWISSGEAHVKGNVSIFYGTLAHNISSYVAPEYQLNIKLARVGSPGSDNTYGLYFSVDDTGEPSLPYFWFTIWPGSSSQNWALFTFLSSGTNSQWVLVANDSKGTSSLIKTSQNQWNEVSLVIEQDKTIIIRIGDLLLYQTDELADIESSFGIRISMNITKIGVRTDPYFEVKTDNVQIMKSGSLLKLMGAENTAIVSSIENESEDHPAAFLPSNLAELKTLRQAIQQLVN